MVFMYIYLYAYYLSLFCRQMRRAASAWKRRSSDTVTLF